MNDIFERFTERARQVVVLAQDEARKLKHNYIGTEHVLLGLLREGDGLGRKVLDGLGISEESVRKWVAEKVGLGDDVITGQLPFTPRAKKILELALREALSLGHNYIGTEHILLALVRETEGAAYDYLMSVGADPDTVRAAILNELRGPWAQQRRFTTEELQRKALKDLKLGIRQMQRGIDTLEAALEQEMPEDPDRAA